MEKGLALALTQLPVRLPRPRQMLRTWDRYRLGEGLPPSRREGEDPPLEDDFPRGDMAVGVDVVLHPPRPTYG